MLLICHSEGRDPEDYVQINKELKLSNLRLMERALQIIVANKMDMPESQENLKEFIKKLWPIMMSL